MTYALISITSALITAGFHSTGDGRAGCIIAGMIAGFASIVLYVSEQNGFN